ncbi:MAG: DUF4340 domain-containing protein, partial [Thermodesulfobacteriota bacterium]|nr:DUF4340 domain-containing protein [Thermodesulfobacteriota bacterium]
MDWRKTLILIGILIALIGYFYIFEIRGAAERKLTEAKKKREEWYRTQVFPYQPQEFKKITLVKNGQTIIYQKRDGVWWMEEPYNIEGSEDAANDIIFSIINVVETDPIADDPSDLAQFGLHKPPITISVELEGTAGARTLFLGNDNPTSITLYATVEGFPRVFLVGSLIRWEVNKE